MSDVVCCLWAAGGFDRAAQGVLGAGRRLADSLGGKLYAVALGPASEALNQGAAAVADRVLVADHPQLAEYHPELYLKALAAVCQPLAAQAVLLGNDSYSQELAARLAHRLGGSAAGDAVNVTAAGQTVRVTRGVYGGKAVAAIELKRAPAVVWTRARALAPADGSGRTAGPVEALSLDLAADERVKVVTRHVEAREGVRLEDAQVIVS
ncbi:MAG: hypothetical protein WD845_08690, partial [Pirellulales bacterium]